jgi:hypothetical protein
VLGACWLAVIKLTTSDRASEKAGSRSRSSSGSTDSRRTNDRGSATSVLRVLPASDSASATLGSAGRDSLRAALVPECALLDESPLYRDRLPPASENSDAAEPRSLFAAWRDRSSSNRLSDERVLRRDETSDRPVWDSFAWE